MHRTQRSDEPVRSDAIHPSSLLRPARRRSWPVLTVFACIVALQLLVAVLSIDLMSAVRAYVTGESLYSKGQKDAYIHLINYSGSHREEDYQRFQRSLAAPLGFRFAREALQKANPDVEAARRGFLQGGTHGNDIPGAIRLFRLFHDSFLMRSAIATWTEGDALIEQMRLLASTAHQLVNVGERQAVEVGNLKENAERVNERLTELEGLFANQLSDQARLAQHLLLGLNLTLGVLLGLSGLAFVRYSSQVQAATEDEVRRRQESLQRLLDSAAEGLYGVDTNGRCTFINRSALEMLGYEEESDLLGRDMHALVRRSDVPAANQQRSPNQAVIARVSSEPSGLHVVGDAFWRRDGTSFPVEYWSHPMMKDGKVTGAVATFFDVSERMNMQAALRQGEDRMAGLIDAVNDGVMTIDADERVVLFNRAAERLFGVAAKDAIGATVERFIPSRTQQGSSDRAAEFAFDDTDKGQVRELFGKRADGARFPLEATLSRLDTGTGTLVTAVLRDASDLQTVRAERQAREALEASNRAKSEFLSRMSHELRTPLNAVLGFSQLLRLDASEPPSLQQLERIQHIENAGAHLLALVNDVLDLSRVESGHMTVALESVDVRSAVEDAVSMVIPMATAAGVDMRVSGPQLGPGSQGSDDQDVSIWADRVRLRQVLVNLLSNAVKYNRRNGEVRIGWQVSDGRCELRVADDGLGISPEKLQRLFEPFNRLGAENSKIEGTGIGLVLSRRLTELMHGELRIASAIGFGTQASLTLQASLEEPVRPVGISPPSQHGSFDDALTVLYAEDNEVNVEIVRSVARLRPSVVLDVAENGAAALQTARRDLPQLMLVDMNLGDMTGIELAQALRADPSTAAIRLVAVSADALPEQIALARSNGFEDYITKPIDFRKLLDVLDRRHSH